MMRRGESMFWLRWADGLLEIRPHLIFSYVLASLNAADVNIVDDNVLQAQGGSLWGLV